MNRNIFQQFLDLNLPNNKLFFIFGAILFAFLIKKYVSIYIANFFYFLIKKANKKINKDAYFNLLVKPLETFIWWILVIVLLNKLTLPTVVSTYSFYQKINVGNILHTISVIILIIVFVHFLIKIIDYIATFLEDKANKTIGQDDNQLVVFFKDFFKVILVIVGFLLLLKFGFNQQIGNLLTGLSLVGAAIALATKESLENLIASFVIFFDKPFVTGDLVKVHNVTGQVEHIGLRSTRIRTEEKTYVTVPNKQMVDSIVDNLSMRTKRKVVMKLELENKSKMENIKLFLKDVELLLKENKLINESNVYLAEINKFSNLVQVEYITDNLLEKEIVLLKNNINFSVLELMKKNELVMAIPV